MVAGVAEIPVGVPMSKLNVVRKILRSMYPI